MKFVRVTIPKFDSDYGYRLKVTNLSELFHYFVEVRDKDFKKAYTEYLNSAEYRQKRGGEGYAGHFSSPITSMIALAVDTAGPISPAEVPEVISNFVSGVLLSMYKTMTDDGALYIAQNGSYFSSIPEVVELDSYEIDSYTWKPLEYYTEADVRIMTWEGGSHFYAKVGHYDVVWKGEQKWDSEDDTNYAASCFKDELNKELKEKGLIQ